jgi:hypothetical protein
MRSSTECFLRRSNIGVLFHIAVIIMLVFDVMAVVLFLIWLCLVSCSEPSLALHFAFRNLTVQGVVVRPALAIPFFTGVATFIGNIISLTSAIRNWQDTVINLALEKLQIFLDPLKPTLSSALDAIIEKIDEFDTNELPPLFAHMSDKISTVRTVKTKLETLKHSINSGDLRSVVSTAAAIHDDAITGVYEHVDLDEVGYDAGAGGFVVHEAQKASSVLHAEALSLPRHVGQLQFRKLKESELAGLFNNLWSSIRCLPTSLIHTHKLNFHSQRGARVIFSGHSHCTDHIVFDSRPLLGVYFHWHRHFFRRDRPFCCNCQCWTHIICWFR